MTDAVNLPVTDESPTLYLKGDMFNDEMINQKVGNYIIEALLGEGGMGKVYKGKHEVLEKSVAVKLTRPDQDITDEQVRRFVREIKICSNLEHKNIVTFYDAGRFKKSLYMAMEFFLGYTLDELFNNTPGETSEVVKIGMQICNALKYAHQKNIIHRDIKPQNIMINDTGTLKVLDFGLAKSLEDSAFDSLTMSGTILGSPMFMAPEQINSPEEVDKKTDLFAVGAVLYYCLAGHAPYLGDSAIEIAQKVSAQNSVVPLAKIRNDIPRELAEIIDKAMQYKKEERFADAEEMYNKLAAISNGDKENEGKEKVNLLKTHTNDTKNNFKNPYLKIFIPDQGCRETPLNNKEITIGRSEECDIMLNHPSVSRRHAVLKPAGFGYVIEDCASSDGTFVNGVQIDRSPLKHGDSIQITRYAIEYSTVKRNVNAEGDLGSGELGSYKHLPAGMKVEYRIIDTQAENLFSSGDTITVGSGGILLFACVTVPEGSCLELQLIWPNSGKARFLGEVIGKVKEHHKLYLAVKLHKINKETIQSLYQSNPPGEWKSWNNFLEG